MTTHSLLRLIWASAIVLPLTLVLAACGDGGPAEDEVAARPLVLIADFVSEGGTADQGGKDAAATLIDDLEALFADDEDVEIERLGRAVTPDDGAQRARELGEDEKALLVIWGSYSGQGEALEVTPNFEVLDRPELGRAQARVAVAQITSFGLESQRWQEGAWLPAFVHGLVQYWRGFYDDALEDFEEVSAESLDGLGPDDKRTVLLYRGNSHLYTGDLGRAADDYTELIALNGQDSMAYYNRALAHARAGSRDEDKAIADFVAAATAAAEEPSFTVVPPPQVGKFKTFTVMMGLADAEWKVMREEVLPRFESKQKVRVRPFQFESGNLSAPQLEAMMAIGMDVDIVTQDNMRLAPLVDGEMVEDLTEYQDMIPDTVVPSLLPLLQFDGSYYFMPYRPNVKIAFYNETKFNQHNIEPPRTWDDLLNVASLLHEQEGGGRVAIQGDGPTTTMFEFIWSAGGDPLTLNDEGSVAAFEFLQNLDPYLSACSRHANFSSMNTYIARDICYLGRNWAFAMNVIVRDADRPDVKAYSGWSGPEDEVHVLGGEVIGIPKGGPNKELAVEFIEFLMSKEIQEVLVARMGWPSMRSDAYGKVEDWQKPYFDAVLEAMENAQARPNVLYWEELSEAITDAFEEIVLEKKPVQPTLDGYAEVIREAREATGE